jgi:hypothetical protein
MGFDTDDTLLNSYPRRIYGQNMSRDLEGWLKSRMAEINQRLSDLSSRFTRREAKGGAK